MGEEGGEEGWTGTQKVSKREELLFTSKSTN